MTDFKTVKKAMYSTPMDVRSQLEVLGREITDNDDDLRTKQEIPDSVIEQHIYGADSIIEMYLVPVYGGTDPLANQTPYFKGPIPVKDNLTNVKLNGVVLASTAITEQWLIIFTGTDAYSVIGSFSGNQGTGTLAGDFTSSNSDVQILAADWYNPDAKEVSTGAQFIFGSYISHPIVNTISSMIACGKLIDSLYSDSEGKPSSWGKTLYTNAIKLLENLSSDKHPASLLSYNSEDVQNPAVQWNIDENGRDQTEYLDGIDNDFAPHGF
jgi:hypothetical protein